MSNVSLAGGTSTGDAPRGFHAKLPVTTLGKWSMWLAVTFIVLFVINGVFIGTSSSVAAASQTWRETLLPFYGIGMMLVGFSAGVVGLVAILKQKERSLITLLTLFPTLFVLFFVIGEFAVPH